jgi:NADPH-dependent glutamate synthase beta subunit-like oxidoreductase
MDLEKGLERGFSPPVDGGRAAVVGAGPAGLGAAYHLRLLGDEVRVFDFMNMPGGLMRYGIPEYRPPKEILEAEISRIKGLGAELEMNTRIGRDISWERSRLSMMRSFWLLELNGKPGFI